MRLVIIAAAVAALSLPAFAQQQRPPQQQQQQRPPAPPPQQAQPEEPAAAPGMFACRTEAEVCFIAIVIGPNQVSVLYTNDPNADGVEQKPVSAQPSPGSQANLGQHTGRVVMLTGRYSAQAGLTGIEIVDVAGPLLSFAIKSMLAGEGEIDEEEEPEPEPAPPPKPQPRQQQQQRR
jgi:hypothetical protein